MSNDTKAKLYKEAFDLLKQTQELLIAAREKHEQQPAEGEEIMVNTPYDVFTLPLHPSGLPDGPRFVVHAPGPEQPAADQFIATFRCEDNGIVGTTDAKIHSVTRHDDGVIEVVIDHWPNGSGAQPAEVEALWAEVEVWKASFEQAADGHATYAERAERLAEALAGLITWIPSAATYRSLGFDPNAPMRALAKARAVLAKEGKSDD
jgi:hypothetical protein